MKPKSTLKIPAREINAWAMFDFANSGYTTVVLTAIYNTFFVAVIAGQLETGQATLLWTLAISLANLLVLLTAPMIGAMTDVNAGKKKLLAISAFGCAGSTAALALAGPGEISLALILVVISSFLFFTGENLIAAFLPEISSPDNAGRISARGWTVGYLGGLITLGICLAWVSHAEALGQTAQEFVPVTLLIVAVMFALAALPTFIWLKERKQHQRVAPRIIVRQSWTRLRDTWQHARHYQDLFRFLLTLMIYHCGINTVVVIAAIYAQQVMGFSTRDSIMLILVVNVSAAIGAMIFGQLQDRIGARNTLSLTLIIWCVASLGAWYTDSRSEFWFIANLVGIALGASQSGGRALVSTFSPPERSGEFFGLWGLATKLSSIIGPLAFGLISWLTQGDLRTALLSTIVFFILGLLLLYSVDEQRGRRAAQTDSSA